uniref:Uncharacterized protein n=1 Tax=Onchocerca volvulus TaxID=6282 RepID=A0A8R1Y4E9_ONCVO
MPSTSPIHPSIHPQRVLTRTNLEQFSKAINLAALKDPSVRISHHINSLNAQKSLRFDAFRLNEASSFTLHLSL